MKIDNFDCYVKSVRVEYDMEPELVRPNVHHGIYHKVLERDAIVTIRVSMRPCDAEELMSRIERRGI